MKIYKETFRWVVCYVSASAPSREKKRDFGRIKQALDYADMVSTGGGKAAVYCVYNDAKCRGTARGVTFDGFNQYMVYRGRDIRSSRPGRTIKLRTSSTYGTALAAGAFHQLPKEAGAARVFAAEITDASFIRTWFFGRME